MEKYAVPVPSSKNSKNPNPITRWKRIVSELNGRISSKCRHEDSQLLLDSYAQVRTFQHHYKTGSDNCPTYIARITNVANHDSPDYFVREGITGIEFDSKGIYLASVTKSGCLTVHDFETLYCSTYGPSSSSLEDETNYLLHISTSHTLDAVRWNPENQDEVACSSRQNNKVLLYDIGYMSSEPVEVLERGRSKFSQLNDKICNGLSDIAFTSADKSRLLASGLDGAIYIWDRRSSNFPCVELNTISQSQLNSIQVDTENRVVFGASKQGIIYAWDLRGGRTSLAFQSLNEVHHPPLISLKVSSVLEKITSLKAQSNIISKEIHSVNIDPSCSYQLAFHLDDGWSGILNTNSLNVTHVHCPPPAWLDGMEIPRLSSSLRRPAWLLSCSIYAVGSTCGKGIHLLDFFPDRSSACHVDFMFQKHYRGQVRIQQRQHGRVILEPNQTDSWNWRVSKQQSLKYTLILSS
ncbi:uncharacterized protein A4U43_C01F33330 [Asparagus officinalis]|uniref:Uncharacterized protein n=1 Tax=Asparagus officinalis TaxID=4686 RepID=A0A5P1FVN4_ASPOF|nr:uncharacterized protein A4U43_C01F33330 [Asparagus officinalis]